LLDHRRLRLHSHIALSTKFRVFASDGRFGSSKFIASPVVIVLHTLRKSEQVGCGAAWVFKKDAAS
jgi:hypothetical protein